MRPLSKKVQKNETAGVEHMRMEARLLAVTALSFSVAVLIAELEGERGGGTEAHYFVARPLRVNSPECLRCHSIPDAAPRSMVTKYGTANGFGWKLGDVAALQIVEVPTAASRRKAFDAVTVTVGCIAGTALILQRVMSATRSTDDAASELDEVLAEIAQPSAGRRLRTSDTGRLDFSSYQSLITLGTRYVGPVSQRLCDRIAGATDDPWVAYRAFASFLPEAERREEFLASAPRRSLRSLPVGSWIRADPDDTGRAVSQSYRAQTSCTLLVWNDPALVTHLRNLDAPTG